MFVLFIEVVVYDLCMLEYVIFVIYNNLFGCVVGDFVIEFGFVCIVDDDFL